MFTDIGNSDVPYFTAASDGGLFHTGFVFVSFENERYAHEALNAAQSFPWPVRYTTV